MTETTSKSGSDPEKNGKRDKYSPPTKVVIRRLPPSMTKEEFEDQVSPIPDHDYLRFVKADPTLDRDAFCTAYINFIDQNDVYIFQERFDGYVFVDNKGNEYISIVEFAPNQKIPSSKEQKKRDVKINTIEQDPDYLKFLEMLENRAESTGQTVEQTLEQIEHRAREAKAGRGLENQMTPLLQFFKDKKEEKMKKREELKELRRKKEEERRKAREEEKNKRKEKEIKEREKRDKKESEKKNDKIEEDIKTRQLEKKKERQGDAKGTESKEEESGGGGGEAEKKTRKEREREKRIQREEREKERFRKREEERRKRKEEEKEKKKLKEKEKSDSNDQCSKEDIEEKNKNQQQKKFKEAKGSVANEDLKDESKTKKYSDRRKEDKLRREKEKSDKKKKEEIITIDDDTSRDDVLGDLSEAAQSLSLKEVGEPAETVKKEKRKSYRERREEKKHVNVTDSVEGEDKQDKVDLDKEKKDRRYKKPDIQIYRPGMGRFSSKKTLEKKEDTKSPKSSPEESRDSSPNKKLSTKSSRNASPEEKKGRANRKPPTDEEKKGKIEEPTASTTPTEERKETSEEQTSEQPLTAPSAPRSKGYRANRIVKSKKKDLEGKVEGVKEKVDTNEKLEGSKPFDENKIPPLTSGPHVITLDNDKID